MAEKTLNTRIINKHDIEENWLKATGFTPKQGEIIVYDIDDNYNYERFKIGDGVQNVNALPFVDDALKTALKAEIGAISDLVGDVAVSEQINTAIESSKADWSQNDETAANFIKNRTHYDNTVTNDYTFTFDGTLEGKEYYDFDGYGSLYYVKVSDETPSVEEIVGATITISDLGHIGQYEVFEDMITTEELITDFVGYEIRALYGEAYVAVVFEDTAEMTKGTWFLYHNQEMRILYPTKLSYSITIGELKQLEPKYIKDMYYDSRGAGEINITFDGNLDGKEYLDFQGNGSIYFVKVSDLTPSINEIVGGKVSYIENGEVGTFEILEEHIEQESDTLYGFASGAIMVVLENTEENGMIITKGIWFLFIPNDDGYFSGLSYTITTGELKKIDEKYLPEMNYIPIPQDKLVCTGVTAMSGQGAASIGVPDRDTPYLEAGKTYSVYVDGILSYTATCVDFDSGNGYIYQTIFYPENHYWAGSSIIQGYFNNVYRLSAWTVDGKPWSDPGLKLEIYEEISIPKEYLPYDIATQSDVDNLASNIDSALNLKADKTEINAAKEYILLKDAIYGVPYKIQIIDGELVSSLPSSLDDFTYTTNADGTYTITGWKQTYLGKPSTEMIVPNDGSVII